MRHITLVPFTASPVFGGCAVVRRSTSPCHAGLRHLGIVGLTSLSLLTMIIADARAQAGDELNEPSPVLQGSPDLSDQVPPVPMNVPGSGYAPQDIGSSPSEVSANFIGNEPTLIQDMTLESFPGEASTSLDLYAPMPPSEILMPMISAPVMMRPKTFVHEPRLVRMSDRSAEIWVTLPERAYVSVNSVEYPPEGTFRIFRTKLTTQEPRRFYISARQGNGRDEITLSPTTILAIDEASGRHFVDLFPGQRAEINFPVVDAYPTQSYAAMPDVTSQQALAPRDASSSVTRRFHFDEAGSKVTGKASVQDGRGTAIDWTNHPDSVSLVVPKSIKALPARPFEATVTFSLSEGGAEPFSTFEPMTIDFHDAGDNVIAQIVFLEHFAGALTDALVKAHAGPGVYHIGATISYDLQPGELGNIVVSGSIGNTMQLVIQP